MLGLTSLSQANFENLKNKVVSESDKSWHWHGKGLVFDETKKALEMLDKKKDSRAAELRTVLKAQRDEFLQKGFKEASGAIGRLIGTEKQIGVWSVPDVPVEFYSEMSDEALQLPEALSFALSQGSVLQSAREAVIYRMNAGKDDFNYYYSTRTAAIYFRQGDALFVAFDDDAFENILLLKAEEGKQAGGDWLVDVNNPLISRAIYRAKNNNRIIQVTNENTRSDSIKVSECIIGDKTKEYADFVKKHLSRELKSYVLDNSDCSKVSSSKVLCRLVGLRGVYGNLNAYVRCDDEGRARGVQKISSGNQGWLPYVGLMIFKKLQLNEAGVSPYFNAAEAQLEDKKAISLFYAGLGACKDYINRKEELDEIVKLLIPLAKRANDELKETKDLFSGLPLHKKLIYSMNDINLFLMLYFRIMKRTPKQAKNIYEDIKLLIDYGLIKNTAQLADVDTYLSEFQFLTPERYERYLSLDPKMRIEFLRSHKKKYLAIALGEQHNIGPDDYELIWYAVNSKNLTKEIIQKTLQRFGNEASKLAKPVFEPFDIKDLTEITGYKANNLKKEYGELLATISLVLLEENYPYAEILKILGLQGKDIRKEILALTQMQNAPVNDSALQLVYKKAYPQMKTNNYLHDLAWLLAVKFTADSDFGEDQKRALAQASKLNSLNYESPTKTEAETILAIYNQFIELYNDTIKHHFDDEKFLKEIHKPKSKIINVGKELEKIKPVLNKNKIHIKCIPSKAPLDLFYGFYGENCTSSYPQELFDEPFIPVRIIQMSEGEPTIEGCIHFYTTSYKGKKILAILGVEPRGDFTNKNDPAKMFLAINSAIEEQAKKHGFDYVCYPENATMHSNRAQIASKISELIREKDTVPLDFNFPKDHSSYTTRKLYITWKK